MRLPSGLVKNSYITVAQNTYRKVTSSNMSLLEANAGFFRLLMKRIFYPV